MNQQLIDSICSYFATQPVLKAWVFGSYARGEQTPESDIDILVDFDRDNAVIGLFEHVRMLQALEKLLNCKVDLVENGSLLPFALESAEQDKKLIYERSN